MRVTDFRLVTYFVPDGTHLPGEVRRMLELYQGTRVRHRTTGETGTLYEIPIYLMQEWLAKYDPQAPIELEALPFTCG